LKPDAAKKHKEKAPKKGKLGPYCDVKSYKHVPFKKSGDAAQSMGDLSRGLALGKLGVTKTTYSYRVHIDGEKGIFYTSCSCFLGFVVNQISPAAFDEIPVDKCVNPPSSRANMWSEYFRNGPAAKKTSKHWVGIQKVIDAKHGDVLSWGFSVDKKTCQIAAGHKDTGHVMFIVNGPKNEPPVRIEGNMAYVWVADGSNLKHMNPYNVGARYSSKAVTNSKQIAFGKLMLGKTTSGSPNSGIGMGVIGLEINKKGIPTGGFMIQKKLVKDAVIGIGRALGK